MTKKNDKYKLVAIGSLFAGAAGYIAGILTAPKSGKDTRDDIKNAAINSRKEAEAELKKLHTELNKVIDEAKARSKKASNKSNEELKELVEKTQDSKEKVREVLSAIHEGDAEDDDLKRAISSATIALEHLKDYLQK